MSKYLLTCSCGKTVPVDVGQAGGRVACSCGTQLDVPTLRQLRHLLREQEVEQRSAARAWGTRQGWVTAALIVVAALLAWSAWSWWSQPRRPKFVAEEYMADVDKVLSKWKPIDAWERWIGYYRPLAEHTLPLFQAGNAAQIEYEIGRARFLRGMLLAVAVAFAALAAAIAFWPKPVATKTGRGGDRERGR